MLRLSLLGEGGSDVVLLEPLSWLLRRDSAVGDFRITRTDFGLLPNPPRTLAERVSRSFEVDAPDILLIHRDNDGEPIGAREDEILRASRALPLCVPVVPVITSETWFLFDEMALRRAAGSTDVSIPLSLPRLRELESVKRPKVLLRDSLQVASGLSGKRLSKFNWRAAYHRLARTITDFEPLLELPAFGRTADALAAAVRQSSTHGGKIR